jgi:ribosome-associated protein
LEIAKTIANALEEKKGESITILDIEEIAIFAEYFVICSGTTERMIQSLLDSAIDNVKKKHKISARTEGTSRDGWMLADFGDVILHVFSPAQRDYYQLEELWIEGKVLLHLQ